MKKLFVLFILSTASGFAASLTVSWDAVPGATGYTIERAPDATTNFAKVTDVTTISYVDSSLVGGTKYSYRVKAFNAVAVSPYSNTASGVTPLSAPNINVSSPVVVTLKPNQSVLVAASK